MLKKIWIFCFYCSNLISLSENKSRTATIAITIAAPTDNTDIRLIDTPLVTETGIGVAVGAGKTSEPVEGAVEGKGVEFGAVGFVDGVGAGRGVVCGSRDDCDTCVDGGK